MKVSFALITPLLLLSFAPGARPAELRNQFEIGRNYYEAGDFKRAVSHLQMAVRLQPEDARSYFWLGKSYEMLALINTPVFGSRSSRAHASLLKALELAPENREYRSELFEFLLNSRCSPSALREAENILQTVNESDPDYPFMQRRLQETREGHSSPEYRAAAVLFAPLQIVRIVHRPVPPVM